MAAVGFGRVGYYQEGDGTRIYFTLGL